jgi:hypothetical protein
MDSIEGTHAFIVRIWYEPREIEHTDAKLRGTVEHIGSGKRISFGDLETAMQFIREKSQQYQRAFGESG